MFASKDWIERRDQELKAKYQVQIADIQKKESNWKKEDEACLLKFLSVTDDIRDLNVQLTQLEHAQASTETKHQVELEGLQGEEKLERKKNRKMALLRKLVALEDKKEAEMIIVVIFYNSK